MNKQLQTRGNMMFPTRTDLESMMKSVDNIDSCQSYPKMDIYSTHDHTFIDLAVAGFQAENISVYTEDGTLIIKGAWDSDDVMDEEIDGEEPEVLYRQHGISHKDFHKRFPLVPHAKVEAVTFINGLLSVKLSVELPEELKPVYFDIMS